MGARDGCLTNGCKSSTCPASLRMVFLDCGFDEFHLVNQSVRHELHAPGDDEDSDDECDCVCGGSGWVSVGFENPMVLPFVRILMTLAGVHCKWVSDVDEHER